MPTFIKYVCTAAALAAASLSAQAVVLFDSTASTGIYDGTTPKQANTGVGQALAFDPGIIPQAIGSFGFLVTAPADTSFKYVIFYGKTQKLFEITRTTTVALTKSLFLSPEFSFAIPQSNQYTFAMVANKAVSYEYDTQSPPLAQNGITEMRGQNANYVGFAPPLYDRDGLAEIKMVLNGVSAVPEAQTWALLLGGLALLGAVRLTRGG